jgi:hypothetical protein
LKVKIEPFFDLSPNPREEAEACFPSILRIALELFVQGFVFEAGADDEMDDAQGAGDEGVQRSQGERDTDQIANRTQVHRVPDKPVGAGCDDFVSFLRLLCSNFNQISPAVLISKCDLSM